MMISTYHEIWTVRDIVVQLYQKAGQVIMGKSKRLIQLMMVLNSGRKYTVRELADQFGVSYRTMWRDLQDLEELGVPLLSEAGIYGGYQVIRESVLPPTKVQEPFRIEGTIIEWPAFAVAGYEIRAPYSARGEFEVLVPRLWFQLLNQAERIPHRIEPMGKLGLCLLGEKEMIYYVTVEVRAELVQLAANGMVTLPEGMMVWTIPARTYALFTHRGSAERVSVDETHYGIRRWLAREGWERDIEAPWVERFDERFNPTAADNAFDIFIPVGRP